MVERLSDGGFKLLIVHDLRFEITFSYDTLVPPGTSVQVLTILPIIGPSKNSIVSRSGGLEVDNLETAMKELKNNGVVISPQIIEDGPLRIVYFTDPDKNALYLCQYSKGAHK